MAIVVKWRADGEYLGGLVTDGIFPWSHWGQRKNALRFVDIDEAKRQIGAHFMQWPVWHAKAYRFVRLVPRKRHAPPQP
jgi:hypothetical protein